jgi:hypothetical protein
MVRYLVVHRKGYRRKDGTWVRPTTFKIRDRGAPGRGRKVIKIRHPGRLRELGYSVDKPAHVRRRALRKAVRKYGERSVIGMLHAQAVFRKRTDSARKVFEADRTWVAKFYGGYRGRRAGRTRPRLRNILRGY